jgi:peroxiredoxin
LKEIRALDAEVLAVSVDPPERNRAFAESQHLELRLLSDPGAKTIERYGLLHSDQGPMGDIARPATLILDRQGLVVWRDLTDNWRVRTRPEDVLRELRQIP